MKKRLSVALFGLGLICSQAQGLISFSAAPKVYGLINFTAVKKVYMPDGSLVPAGTFADFLAGPDVNSLVPIIEEAPSPGMGSWIIGPTSIPGILQGTTAFVQMRAWVGAPDFRSAILEGQLWGESTIQESPPLSGGLQPAPIAPIDSFTLIPEPSTIVFAIFGFATLFIRNWR